MLKEGDRAPDFELEADDGSRVRLSSLKGKTVIVYFYPKDDTPGCTTEACGFRDSWGAIKAKGAVVLGVSPDSAASHVAFKGKFSLPFTLLADPDKKVLTAWGGYGKKMMYGKEVEGVIRSTFIVGPEGTVVKVFPKVKAEGHAAEVLAALGG